MKNLSYFLAIAAAGTLTMSASTQARGHGHGGGYGDHVPQHRFEERVDRRQARQWDRINDGIDSGELSRGEAKRLMRSQRRIARMEDRFARDGYYSPRERRKLERVLDRTSKRIRRAKHNDVPGRGHHRGWRGWPHRHHVEHHTHVVTEEAYAYGGLPGTFTVQFDDFNVSWSPSYHE